MNALELTDVHKSFGGLTAVAGVTLTIPTGERHGLLGPNGAGKTTLFNLIAGDLFLSSGTIRVLDQDVTRWEPWRRARLGLARTYQISRLMGDLSVRENLFLAVLGVRKGHYRVFRSRAKDAALWDRADELADQIGLAHRRSDRIRLLSHGEHRQVELGMALASQPRVLLLDEPAAGLSPAERRHLAVTLAGLDRDITLVLVEHDMDIALEVSDRITLLQDGVVIDSGTPEHIRHSPIAHDVYLGTRP